MFHVRGSIEDKPRNPPCELSGRGVVARLSAGRLPPRKTSVLAQATTSQWRAQRQVRGYSGGTCISPLERAGESVHREILQLGRRFSTTLPLQSDVIKGDEPPSRLSGPAGMQHPTRASETRSYPRQRRELGLGWTCGDAGCQLYSQLRRLGSEEK